MKNDFGKLEHWEALFRNSQVLVTFTLEAMAKDSLRRVKDGFVTETDPYGKRWKPKKKPDGRKTLSGPTGRLKRWRVKQLSGNRGYTLYPSVDYAAPHQAPRRGARPRRMMVPSRSRGMPATWKAALNTIAMKTMSRYFAGKLKKK